MSDEAQAKQRFVLLNLVRLGGLLMVLAAIAGHQGALPLPQPVSLILAGLGLFEFFFLPNILARQWRTRDDTQD